MKYVIEVSKAVADQRRVEGQGVADYNRIVSTSLSPPILEYERIQTLNRLATSPNAKTVVMGPGTEESRVLLSAPASTR